MPTVHVIGAQDSYAVQGHSLAAMCEPRVCQTILHQGGHEFPRDSGVLTKVAEAMQVAVERMGYQ